MPGKGFDVGVVVASGVAAALVVGWLALGAMLVYWALPTPLAQSVAQETLHIAATYWPLLLLLLLMGLAGVLLLTRALRERYVLAMSRLVERMTMAVRAERLVQLPVEGGRAQQSLAKAANALLQERDSLRHQMHDQVANASASIATERDQLAALMAELKQSVLVCNAQATVLLYNEQAGLLLKNSMRAGVPLGIGRSLRELFDTGLVDHALRTIASQHQRGVAKPSAEFVAASGNAHMLRVQLAAVMRADSDAGEGQDAGPHIDGYVLLLQDATQEHHAQAQRDAWLYDLTHFSRASLASLQTAIAALQQTDLTEAQRVRWRARIQDDVRTLGHRLASAADTAAQQWVTRWPLQDMAANDFLSAAAQDIESWVGVRMIVEPAPDDLWLKLDSYSLVQALAHQSACLVDAFRLRYLTLRAIPVGNRAQLDLAWTGQVMSTETAMSWELDPMIVNGGHVAMSVRDVISRHGARMSFDRARAKHEAFFRWELPAVPVSPAVAITAAGTSSKVSLRTATAARPEFFDFDLFQANAQQLLSRDQALASLTFTVFDTEATGLNPSLGDEIIQIAAVRIVNGKLRVAEYLDQLVDPKRRIPAASIPIHGITDAMVAGQPNVVEVLPQFHAFVGSSVLVAHNAAFDMRLLELKQDAIGLRFDQPVVDTLLLAAVLYPDQATHGLEALASRLGVDVSQRHNALADALVTARVWLKMLPMLQEQGITTLGQALAASQETYYARLKY